jgi:hypothetical protein
VFPQETGGMDWNMQQEFLIVLKSIATQVKQLNTTMEQIRDHHSLPDTGIEDRLLQIRDEIAAISH